MTIQVFGADATVSYLNRAFTDTSPSNAIFKNQVARVEKIGDAFFANEFAASWSSVSDAALSKQVLTNFGVLPTTNPDVAALETILAGIFTANSTNRGIVVLNLAKILADLESTATGATAVYKDMAAAWNAEVTAAYTYSSNTANVAPSATGVSSNVGQTFTLTTNSDTINGTTANDTITGIAATTNPTANSADTIDGAAGTDTLKLTIDTLTATSVPNFATTNVEVIDVRNVSGNAQTINANNYVGSTSFVSNVSSNNLTFTNVKTPTVTIQGNGSVEAGSTTIAVTGTAGNATPASTSSVTTPLVLNISGGTKANATPATSAIIVSDTNADWTTATINSTGAANAVGSVNLSGVDAATTATHTIKDLTINATTNIAFGSATDTGTDITGFDTGASVTNTITVTGAATSVSLNDIAAVVDVINAAGLTAGGVTANLKDVTATGFRFTGGTGSDTVVLSANTPYSTASALIDAGAGVDTLALTSTTAVVTADAPRLKNFETLELKAAVTQDASLFTASAIDKIVFNFAGGAAVTNASAAQAANVLVKAAPTNLSIGVKGADTVGQMDTVKVTVDDGDAAVNTIALGTPVLTGVETLELTANDNTTITALTSATALSKIVLQGAGTIGITSAGLAPQVNTIIDGSAATGVLTINLAGITSATTTNAVSVIGGTKADILTFTSAGNLVNGKGGLDQILMASTTTAGIKNNIVQSEVTTNADADFVFGFATTSGVTGGASPLPAKFQYKGALVNGTGTSADGIAATEVAGTLATFVANLADTAAPNKVVFLNSTALTGQFATDLTALITGANATTTSSTFTAANITTLINNLVASGGALGGTITNLDSVLGATDSVLVEFHTATDTALFRVTNTDTTTVNTLTASEVQLVGVFANVGTQAAGVMGTFVAADFT